MEIERRRRKQYAQSWELAKGQFVDDPAAAVTAAYGLVRTVMSERGYSTDDFERQADDVSVDHPEVVGDYREAVRISEASGRGEASTEDLREAMVSYRSLFARLLDTDDSEGTEVSNEQPEHPTAGDSPAAEHRYCRDHGGQHEQPNWTARCGRRRSRLSRCVAVLGRKRREATRSVGCRADGLRRRPTCRRVKCNAPKRAIAVPMPTRVPRAGGRGLPSPSLSTALLGETAGKGRIRPARSYDCCDA